MLDRDRLEVFVASANGEPHLVTLRPGIEGLLVPSKIYGILAAGRPTLYVGPRHGEVAEIVADGCGGVLPPGDGEALARAIREYRSDAPRRERDGRRARDLFDSRYSRELQVGRFVKLIEEVVS